MHTKHSFVSGKADGTDVTLVKPSDWNAEHNVITDADGVVLGRAAGAGAGPVQEVAMTSLFSVMTGMVFGFAGATPPAGWLLCNGQSLVRTDYPGLFSVIGTTFGAADATHFNVPDMRGCAAAGADPGNVRLTSTYFGTAPVLGAIGGVQARNATHTGYVDVSGSTSGAQYFSGTFGTDGGNQSIYGGIVGSGDVAHGGHSHNVGVAGWTQGQALSVSAAGSIRNDGNNLTATFAIIQPTTLLNFIIKT